jgi:hypothetical protein
MDPISWVAIGIAVISFATSMYLAYKAKNITLSTKPEEVTGPTATEGGNIGVLFGSAQICTSNIVYYGNVKTTPIKDDQGANITIGYRYYIGIQFAICAGPIDALKAIVIGDKVAFTGCVLPGPDSKSAYAGIWAPYLFGGDKLGGGVTGSYELNFGYVNDTSGADAGRADYVNRMLGMPGGVGPKYYGVTCLQWWQGYVGTSPYLKPWAFRCQRIHKRDGGNLQQWYDEKAEISTGRDREDIWKYLVQAPADGTDYSATEFDDSGWSDGPGGFANAPAGSYVSVDPWDRLPVVRTQVIEDSPCVAGTKIWLRQDLGPIAPEQLWARCWHDDGGDLWFNGTAIPLVPINKSDDAEYSHFNSYGVIPAELINPAGRNVIAYRVVDSYPQGNPEWIYAGIQVGNNNFVPLTTSGVVIGGTVADDVSGHVVDMNPAHMIRESVTDKIWGDGYQDADIDDPSFIAVADRLYLERFGLSMFWDKQVTIEEFISEILRHINGVMYVDRSTGKFVLKLIRGDYNINDLLVLDETNVEAVEDAKRPSTGELVNSVTVTYRNSMRGDTGCVTVHNQGLQAAQGSVINVKVDYPGITSYYNAVKVAYRDLCTYSTPLWSGTIIASRAAAVLNKGSAFVLNWPELGIDQLVLRVVAIELSTATSYKVKITAIEDAFFTPTDHVQLPDYPWDTPELAPLPTGDETAFYPAKYATPLLRDPVIAIMQHGAAYGFSGSVWTPIAPFTWQRLANGALKGQDSGGSGTISLPAGSRLAVVPTALTNDAPYGGIYEVLTEGDNYTPAVIRRSADADSSSELCNGMVFQVTGSGADHEGDFFTLTNSGTVMPDVTDTVTWVVTATGPIATWELLTDAQLVRDGVRSDDVIVSGTGYDGNFPLGGYLTLSGTPGLASIPAGHWEIDNELVWMDPDFSPSVGSSTKLRWTIGRDWGSSWEPLFTMESASLSPLDQPLPITISYDETVDHDITPSDRLVAIPSMVTTSTATVRVYLLACSAKRGTKIKAPFIPVVIGGKEEPFFDVWIDSNGCIDPAGHRKLYVHGTGPLKGINISSFSSEVDIILSFADYTQVNNMSTDTLTANCIQLRLEGDDDLECRPNGEMQYRLRSAYWGLIGGSWR